MNGLPVPCVRISREQRDVYLDVGYNPPSADVNRKTFSSEWWAVFDQVESSVTQYWKPGIGDGDFYMDGEFVPSRFMCIEVSKERVLSTQLLKVVHSAIQKFEPDYAVDICDSWVFLKTKDGDRYPHFNIFVEKKRILIYSESEALLDKLEVPADQRSIHDTIPDEGASA